MRRQYLWQGQLHPLQEGHIPIFFPMKRRRQIKVAEVRTLTRKRHNHIRVRPLHKRNTLLLTRQRLP